MVQFLYIGCTTPCCLTHVCCSACFPHLQQARMEENIVLITIGDNSATCWTESSNELGCLSNVFDDRLCTTNTINFIINTKSHQDGKFHTPTLSVITELYNQNLSECN